MRFVIGSCVILFGLMASAHASVISFAFTGNVTQVPIDEVFGDIDFGDPIQGNLSFDSSATDLIPNDPTTGSYSFSSPLGMHVAIGTHEFDASSALNIGILNSFVDQFTVLATSSDGTTLELIFQDNTGNAFTNDHLPTTAQQLAGFLQRDFHLDAIMAGGEVQADGQITNLVATPEAASQGLTLAALLIFSWLAIRRRVITIN